MNRPWHQGRNEVELPSTVHCGPSLPTVFAREQAMVQSGLLFLFPVFEFSEAFTIANLVM